MRRILVIDDDKTCNEFMAHFLRDEGYAVETVLSAQEALCRAQDFSPNLLVADWLLKDGMDGVEVARELQKTLPGLQLIFTTGSPAEQLREQANDLEIVKVYEKPIDIDGFLADIAKLEIPTGSPAST